MSSVLSYFCARPCSDAAIIMNSLNRTSQSLCFSVLIVACLVACLAFSGCDTERRKSDAELGLNPQQTAGRKLYDDYCDRCHEPYSSRGKKGPSLKGVFKQQYLPISGLPANDDRVTEIVKIGRAKMHGFSQVMNDQQVKDLVAYLHTL
jgi:mono/diheme cytochrome c family protein